MASAAAFRLHLSRTPPPLLSSLHRLYLPTLSLPLSPFPSPSLLLSSRPRFFTPSSSSSLTPISTPLPLPHPEHDEESHFSDSEEAGEGEEPQPIPEQGEATEPIAASLPSFPSPTLSVKEKKELASFAHSLGKKLKCQQVGKSGVTPSVAAAFVENLESNELLKLKVHGSCPGELADVVKQLEEATGSVAVDQIGRAVILYRPSLSKMKKKEAQSARKVWKVTPTKSPASWKVKPTESTGTFKIHKKGQPSRLSGREYHQSRSV